MERMEKEQLLNEVEHKIGMAKTFHNNNGEANELIEVYEGYCKDGASLTEIKLLLEDLELFLDSVRN